LPGEEHIVPRRPPWLRRQRTFGYTEEEVRMLLKADGGGDCRAPRRNEPDARSRFFDYFTQQFAQANRLSTASTKVVHPSRKLGDAPVETYFLLDIAPGRQSPPISP
jgi:glutamate synthase (NADPH/NADH) large chain